ncbi:oxygen-insensitive NADPH nitroreductase [Conchiformibius steedae DSM 2580]|uniref:Oxygen-insensitive NADPH nitroreductase n=2 Tax=Conchiformibius steedae TaxID=153493 RepID=A0A3P2AC34_9NEIS|nr:oxygen-insensitive NADPH nitroreductase [Conchiformibius steedae]QMT32688.1 oxygen-insensitive NADPH nitroreductase [Conchiformibius steedae]RRD91203.1 oxygen-insensitive NADPH nitroreductase [Conchiformibius steedae]URD67297.1 oxygen-insensitive NADPH nitroreductase [Conchiformibius steedae DSM 2580]
MLNSQAALATALNHRSIRKFSEEPISAEMFDAIIQAGQMASTSSFLQSVSVIRVTDREKRKQIREVAAGGVPKGHHYVENCAEFLVFCIDAHRHHHFAPHAQTDWIEVLMVGAVDVGLFAQNVLLTAESLGLGGVYIGGVRNDIQRVSDILNIPEHVIPLVGMCLGHPAHEPDQRPRLPVQAVLSENEYRAADAETLQSYNQTVGEYYQNLRGLDLDWNKQINDTFKGEIRPDMLAYLNKQGFAKR